MTAKYQSYPEYKDSGVEWLEDLPINWEVKRTKAMFGLSRKLVGEKSKDYQLLSLTLKGVITRDISDGGGKIPADFGTYQIVNKSDLVFCLFDIDETPRTIGLSFNDGMITGAYNVYSALDPCVPEYAYYYFLHIDSFKGLKPFYTGLRKVVRAETFSNIKMPVPSIEEQQKIANFLDHETAKIDMLIEKQQQLIKLLKEKRQAVISHAVTKGLNPSAPMRDSGVEWLGEVPEHWAVAKLSYRYQVLLGKMLDDKKITGNHLGYYLRNTDVQWDKINTIGLPQMDFRPHERERYSVIKGDLIVCEGGEIGRCAIWMNDEPCYYQKALHRLRPLNSQIDHTRFLFFVLFDAVYQERFISGAEKATIAHLPAETFKQFRFAFPPSDEQKNILNYLNQQKSKFDLLELKAFDQIDLLQERRIALISAAVTGKIDVRNWQVPKQENTVEEATA